MRNKGSKRIYISLILTLSLMLNVFSPVLVLEANAYTINKFAKSELKVGEVYHGFKLVEEKKLEDAKGIGRVFYHEKSGAKLFALQNQDKNKYFSIGFRTPSYDNKGTAHVLEHCVLVGGSKKYPVKQLLKEVMENSITKDLNGLTTPDSTIYPFSSTNNKEFSNIMDIYLDMVFNPSFSDHENIFKEEGWYYHLDEKGENLKYNGVVYNEMKGALSSPTGHIYGAICKSLYPNTIYSNISGGDPKEITNLTFAELKNFHRKYYHPSNSYSFLYGDINILERLKFLDENYFSKYKKREVDSNIKSEKPFKEKKYSNFTYPIAKDENEEHKSFLTYNFTINEKTKDIDPSLSMLNHMLINNPNSPLVRNLKKHGFTNISGGYVNQQKQPFFTIMAANCNPDEAVQFEKIIDETLREICSSGLDKEIIRTTLNYINISSRFNSSYSKDSGANYNYMVLNKWMYNENPMNAFNGEAEYKKIINSTKTDYFEKLIQKHLIKNTHSSIMVLRPQRGLMEKEIFNEKKKLETYKNSLSKEQLEKLITETRELNTWLNTPSSNEDLRKIPKLELKDVDPKIELMPLNRKKENGVQILYHPWETNDTSFLNMYFDTSGVKEEQIPYIQLLSTLLGNIPSKNYKVGEIYNKERAYTTGINYGVNTYTSIKDMNKVSTQFTVSAVTLSENTEETLNLIGEEIKNSKIDDKRILKVALKSIKESLEEEAANSPHIMALNRNFSNISKGDNYKEKLKGISYIEFIEDLDKNFDKKHDIIVKNLKEVQRDIFNRHNLTLSITTDNKGYETFQNNFGEFVENLSDEKINKREIKFTPKSKSEAFPKNIGVLYNVQGFNFRDSKEEYNGNMMVLKNILDLDYLWPKVRVKGGAYGINLLLNSKGNVGIVSYRDPNLKETFEVYKGIPDYLKNLNFTDKELESYKISALAPYCHTKTIEERVYFADSMYFSDIKREDLERELKEIKNAKLKDIKAYEKMFREGLKKNNITVIGNKREVEKEKKIFNNMK